MTPEEDVHTTVSQPGLFDAEDSSTGVAELFPQLWGITEMLVNSESAGRREALAQLEAIDAARLSPLAAYLLTTFLLDKDLEVRSAVVRILGQVLGPDEQGRPAPDEVRQCLYRTLSQMRTRRVYALLQVSQESDELENEVARLLNACSYAGTHLADISAARKNHVSIRREAIKFIGKVGYLDALPALERLSARLESRQNGQQTLPFAPQADIEESDLLPELRLTLKVLRSP